MVRHAATPAIRRLLVLAVCAGLTTGATGCGDSEGGPDGGAGPSASAATSDERPQSPPEQRSTGPEQRGEQADTAPADGGDGASAAPDARAPERRPSEDPPPVADSEETAVAAVATSMYDAYSRGDAAGVCAVLSDGARKQVSGGAATEAACQETLGRLFAATGGNPSRMPSGRWTASASMAARPP